MYLGPHHIVFKISRWLHQEHKVLFISFQSSFAYSSVHPSVSTTNIPLFIYLEYLQIPVFFSRVVDLVLIGAGIGSICYNSAFRQSHPSIPNVWKCEMCIIMRLIGWGGFVCMLTGADACPAAGYRPRHNNFDNLFDACATVTWTNQLPNFRFDCNFNGSKI